MIKKQSLFIYGTLVFIVVGLFYMVANMFFISSIDAPPSLRVSRSVTKIGSFALEDVKNDIWSLDRIQGQIVLVNFWASWCPPCVEEFSSLQALKKAFKDKPFELLAINIGEDFTKTSAFIDSLSWRPDFPILLDHNAEVSREWSIGPIPTTLILNKKGKATYEIVGQRDWNTASVRHFINELIAE